MHTMMVSSHNTDWSWPRVKAAVEEAGSNLAEIGRREGVDRSCLAKVKTCRLYRMQAAIARVIGVPPQEIWPSRYNDAGRPFHGRAMVADRKHDAA